MESKSNNLKCAFCRGKGIHPNSERLPCVVCQGRGKVEISQPYTKCEKCGGIGRKRGANLYCLSCRGKGFVGENINGKKVIKESIKHNLNDSAKKTAKERSLLDIFSEFLRS